MTPHSARRSPAPPPRPPAALADRHPGARASASSPAGSASLAAPGRADLDAAVTLGDAVARPRRPRRARRGRAHGRPAQRPPPGSAPSVRWNAFGTPASILPSRRQPRPPPPATPAAAAARAGCASHAAVFGLVRRPGRRPRAGQQPEARRQPAPARCCSARRSATWRPRSAAWSPSASATAQIAVRLLLAHPRAPPRPAGRGAHPAAAWLKAAAQRRPRRLAPADVADGHRELGGWTRLKVPGFAQEQQVRLRALALADGTVRPVFEANVVDVQGGAASAYTVLVDAVSGDGPRTAQNQVDNEQRRLPVPGRDHRDRRAAPSTRSS